MALNRNNMSKVGISPYEHWEFEFRISYYGHSPSVEKKYDLAKRTIRKPCRKTQRSA